MDSGMTKTIGLAVLTAVIASFVARADGATVREAGGTLAADTIAMRQEAAVKPKWLNDANALALLRVMNERHVAAADIELSSWFSDTVRAFAASMAREHAEMQRSVDSAASALKIAPVMPALGEEVTAAFQAQIDTMLTARGAKAMDRAYVARQVVSHRMMTDYANQLANVAERPEIQSLLRGIAGRTAAQQARAQTLQTTFAVADSIVADSLARRAARRNRQTPTR
jgi:predicted outer membrane protein